MVLLENFDLLILIVLMIILCIGSMTLSLIAFGKYNSLKKKYDMFISGRDAESLKEFF